MKARLIPLYFDPGKDQDFDTQLAVLNNLLADEVEILSPLPLGSRLPEAEAVVFPQLLGTAYRQKEFFQDLHLPLLVITSEFGTASMWDWEITDYLRGEGVELILPYNLEQTRILVRGLAVKRELAQTKFLVFQDNPGKGFQPEIFKRFYWWEDECTLRMKEKFGLTIIKKSFRELAARAKEIPDEQAGQAWKSWQGRLDVSNISSRALSSAMKIYLAVKEELAKDEHILGAGINCLNESHFSDTTPCLAWNLLYEERRLIWGCEADTVAMLTEYLLNKALDVPVMMTNLYPFLMGQAALKHEHVPDFPKAEAPEDHILVAHCGYLGVLPVSFSTEWALRPKVLAIVDENATAIDARLPEGDITMAKLGSGMDTLSIVEGTLEGYVQYPGSHCVNGGVIRVPDGRKLMHDLVSHHYIFAPGHHRTELELLAKVFDLKMEVIE